MIYFSTLDKRNRPLTLLSTIWIKANFIELIGSTCNFVARNWFLSAKRFIFATRDTSQEKILMRKKTNFFSTWNAINCQWISKSLQILKFITRFSRIFVFDRNRTELLRINKMPYTSIEYYFKVNFNKREGDVYIKKYSHLNKPYKRLEYSQSKVMIKTGSRA